MKLSNGNKYVGDFVDGLMSEKEHIFSNGDIYEGEVFEGNIDGEGKYTL